MRYLKELDFLYRKGLKIIIILITLSILFSVINYLSKYSSSIKAGKQISSILPKFLTKEKENMPILWESVILTLKMEKQD